MVNNKLKLSLFLAHIFATFDFFLKNFQLNFKHQKVHTSVTLAEYLIEVLNSGSRSLTSLSRISNITELLWILSDTIICKRKIRIRGVSIVIFWPCFDSWWLLIGKSKIKDVSKTPAARALNFCSIPGPCLAQVVQKQDSATHWVN